MSTSLPYEAFRRLPRAQEFLKEGITFEKLEAIAKKQSDNEFAALMQGTKEELFNNLSRHKLQFPTIFTTFVFRAHMLIRKYLANQF